jgi:hypothetical protein
MHNEIIKCQEMTKYKYLGEKSELEIWSLQIFSFQRNSTSQLQYDVKTLTMEENLLCLSKLVTEACVKEKYIIEKTNPDELDIHFIIYFSQLWRFK